MQKQRLRRMGLEWPIGELSTAFVGIATTLSARHNDPKREDTT